VFGIQSIPKEEHRMNEHTKRPMMTDAEVRKELMNDSLGTIDTADSTGSDETNLPPYSPFIPAAALQ
jgi:hypothetical protein